MRKLHIVMIAVVLAAGAWFVADPIAATVVFVLIEIKDDISKDEEKEGNPNPRPYGWQERWIENSSYGVRSCVETVNGLSPDGWRYKLIIIRSPLKDIVEPRLIAMAAASQRLGVRLSACSFMWKRTGDRQWLEKIFEMVRQGINSRQNADPGGPAQILEIERGRRFLRIELDKNGGTPEYDALMRDPDADMDLTPDAFRLWMQDHKLDR